MKTEEIIVDGQKQTIVVDFPDEIREEYVDVNMDDTIELDEIVKEIFLGDKDE